MVLLLYLERVELLLLFVLLLDYLGLFGFLSSRLEDSLLNFSLLVLSLLVNRVVVLSNHPLLLILVLIIVDLLLDAVLVALLQREDLVRSLLSVIDLFPCLLLFLLQQGDTIGQQLGISLNTITGNQDVRNTGGRQIAAVLTLCGGA